jgi:hypothetical protein
MMLAGQAGGATWYVRPFGGSYGSANGTSYNNAWNGLGNIVWGASGVKAGDTLYVCGTHTDRWLSVGASGANGSPIRIRGDASEEAGKIRLVSSIPGWDVSGNWQSGGVVANTYYISLASLTYDNPRRLWVNLTEWKQASAEANISAEYPWFYKTATKDLYVYSEKGNPAKVFKSMEGLQHLMCYSSLVILTRDYIDVSGINVEGGNYDAIRVSTSNYINIFNSNIGKDSLDGIVLTTSNYVNIYKNTLDTNFKFAYNYELTGSQDGVKINSGSYNKIYNNIFRNWAHNAIYLRNLVGAQVETTFNEAYDNDISAPDISYGRAFETFAFAAGRCSYNKFYKNNIHDLTVRSQIGGDHNEFYYNIFRKITNSPAAGYNTAQAMLISAYSASSVSINNKIIPLATQTALV